MKRRRESVSPVEVAYQLDKMIQRASVTQEIPAGDYTRFAPGAFDGIVGTQIPCEVQGGDTRFVTVERVEVSEDGTRAYITIEGPVGDLMLARPHMPESFSIGGLS